MSEFENRIDAQRAIIRIVNKIKGMNEQLAGLSKPSISRWIDSNRQIVPTEIEQLLYTAAEKLFFLANESEDQISDKYKYLKTELEDIKKKLIELV